MPDLTENIIYRVIPDGRKTPFMANLAGGSPVRFGGRFGTPIAEGIAPSVDKVIGIATGAAISADTFMPPTSGSRVLLLTYEGTHPIIAISMKLREIIYL